MPTTLLIINIIILILVALSIILNLWQFLKQKKHSSIIDNSLNIQQQQTELISKRLSDHLRNYDEAIFRLSSELREQVLRQFNEQQKNLTTHQLESLQVLQKHLQQGAADSRQQLNETLNLNAQSMATQMEKLTLTTEQRLKDISGQVEKRLTEGFEKTTATFTDVIKRLALIDEAQKKITELSSNVVSLQEVLTDKRSRGAFGEVQLTALIRNLLPENSFAFQHTLKEGKRADCILFLPEPSGHIIIDAKFPLENYRRTLDTTLSETERQLAKQQFRLDIRKHISDIAEKYIVPGETADGAMMFIPAEAIFAEIHAYYADLVEISYQSRVWMVSPTTMMAILTTARAVIKDDATRKQVNIIQDHLRGLAKNFELFRVRMEKLSQHIRQANDDVGQIHISAQKISSQFEKIEKVEIETEEISLLKE